MEVQTPNNLSCEWIRMQGTERCSCTSTYQLFHSSELETTSLYASYQQDTLVVSQIASF